MAFCGLIDAPVRSASVKVGPVPETTGAPASLKITAVDVPAFTFGGSVAISIRNPFLSVFIGKTQTPTIRPPVPEKVHRQRQADRGAVELGT